MMPTEPPKDPYQLVRMEWKYTIPGDRIERISEYAAIYCRLDRYAAASPSGSY